MKRKHVNLLLAAILVAGVALLMLDGNDEPKDTPLTPLQPEDVTQLRIEHPEADAIALEKDGDEWMLTAPVAARSDRYEVNSLLALATTPMHKQFPSDGVDLAALGLAPPKYSVTLNDTRIAFGDTEPLQHQRYVQLGDRVALIDDLGSAAFDADHADLVAKTLLPDGAELQRVALPDLTLVRTADGWQSEPLDASATPERIAPLVEAWSRARAMWNAAENEESPQGEAVALSLAGGEQIHLLVVAREPQLVVSRPDYGVRYHLSKALGEELLKLAPPPAEEEVPSLQPGVDAHDQ